ncbi:hypothetical protein [Nocardioides pacificus]
MRTTLTALALVAGLALSGCSGDDDPEGAEPTVSDPTQSPEETDDREPAEVLHDAVDASLTATSFEIDNRAELDIGDQRLVLDIDGAVDYDELIADATIAVDQSGTTGEIEMLSDGELLWVRGEGQGVAEFPDGATWVEGESSRLGNDGSFEQAGLMGVVLVLRGAEDVEEGETDEMDGVTVRQFTTTIPYEDAVEAAGDGADDLASSFSLTGGATESDLVVEVWVGEDDVVRSFDMEIDGGELPVGGDYVFTLENVDGEITPPEAPADDEILRGPEAEEFLDALMAQ